MVEVKEDPRRIAGIRASAVLVAMTLFAGFAQAAFVVDHYHLGDAQGSESLQIAVITDIHGSLDLLDSAVNRLRAIDSLSPLSVVMVTGDLVGSIDTTDTARLNSTTRKLSLLPCPWVPLMGNHDEQIWGIPGTQ